MRRSPGRWKAMSASAVVAGSEAQTLFCIRDAQADIAWLAEGIQRIAEYHDIPEVTKRFCLSLLKERTAL
jgi:hypothetical protein